MKNLTFETRKDGRLYFNFFDLFLNKNQICIWFDNYPTSHVFAYWYDGFVMKIPLLFIKLRILVLVFIQSNPLLAVRTFK